MFRTIRLKKAFIVILLAAVTIIGAGLSKSHAEEKNTYETKDKIAAVPVIMYHSVQKDADLCGEYVVSTEQVKCDIRYLKENNFTPIFVNDLIKFVKEDGTLPDKPVILTFDDGFYNNYEYLFDLLKEENFKATVSVVGEFTTNASESAAPPDPSYSYLRWKDIREMHDSGLVEFCNHTNSMHKLEDRRGILPMDGEAFDSYRNIVRNDLISLQTLFEKNCGFRPDVFTYPYGFKNGDSAEIVSSCGFSAAMDVEEKPNYIDKNLPECLYMIHRYNRSGLTDTASFMEKLLEGYAGG